MGGEGTRDHCTGERLRHGGAPGRAKGFEKIMKNYPKIQVPNTDPADWDVTKVARIWDTHLTKYPDIKAAFFHRMTTWRWVPANVMKARGKDRRYCRRRR